MDSGLERGAALDLCTWALNIYHDHWEPGTEENKHRQGIVEHTWETILFLLWMKSAVGWCGVVSKQTSLSKMQRFFCFLNLNFLRALSIIHFFPKVNGFFFEIRFHYVALAGLKLDMLTMLAKDSELCLPLPPQCWGCRSTSSCSPHPASKPMFS